MANHQVEFPWSEAEARALVSAAVKQYWAARGGQSTKQKASGASDQGTRSEVTGGQHLNGFTNLLRDVVRAAGFREEEIRYKSGVELPGYFRATKRWDIVVVRNGRLCAALELKSHVGSLGNNFNNRSEEAIGSSTDFWVAFRKGLLGQHPPWLGYFMLVKDSGESRGTVRNPRAVFEPLNVFRDTSYIDRYKILCQHLLLERNYLAAALLASPRGDKGEYTEPLAELSFLGLAKSLFGHLVGMA